MATAVLRIQVATLSDVGDGKSRVDGIPSALVTVTAVGIGGSEFALRFWALSDGAAEPALTVIVVGAYANRQWTFNPGAGYGRTYGIELIVNGSSRNPATNRRIYAIPTQTLGLILPVFGETADPSASRQTAALASVIRESTNNADDNPYGYGPALQNVITALESVGASALTDHGALGGLADDDHTQYLRTDGTRALTGDQSAGGFKVTSLAASTGAGDAVRHEDARLSDARSPTVPSYADGDLIVRVVGAPARLAIGSVGQILRVGVGPVVGWESPPGPRWEIDSTGLLSNPATLFSYWKLQELRPAAGSATDLVIDSLGRNHLRTVGTPGYGAGPSTQEPLVARYTGAGSYEKNEHDVDFLSGSTPWTAAAWVYIDTLPVGGANQSIVGRQRVTNGGGWGLKIAESGGSVFVQSFVGSGGAGNESFLGSSILAAGAWYHIAAGYDGTTFYNWVNGIASSGPCGTTISAPGGDSWLTIGTDRAATSNFLGRIALVALWVGVRQATAQIVELYGAGTPNRLRGI